MISSNIINKFNCKIDSNLIRLISKELSIHNNIDDLVESIPLIKLDIEIIDANNQNELYKHLKIRKKLAQLCLNKHHNLHFHNQCKYIEFSDINYQNILDDGTVKQYQTEYQYIGQQCDIQEVAIFISKYFILYSILYQIQMNSSKDNECFYCDSEIVNGICTLCGASDNEDINPRLFPEDTSYYKNENDAIQINKAVDINQNYPGKNLSSNSQSSQIVGKTKTLLDSNELDSQKTETDINVDHNDSYAAQDNDKIPWTCAYCELENIDQNLQNCPTCEKFHQDGNSSKSPYEQEKNENMQAKMLPSIDKWKCGSCTFFNEKSDKICQVCLEICKNSDGEDIDIDDIEEMWLCGQCNARNSFEFYKCNNCKSTAPFFNKWKCEKCSFFNEKFDILCQICSNDNRNLIQCPQCKKENINKQYDDFCVKCVKINEKSHKNVENQIKISENKIQDTNKAVKNIYYENDTDNKFLSLPQALNSSKQNAKGNLENGRANSNQLKKRKNGDTSSISRNVHYKSNDDMNIGTYDLTNNQEKNNKPKNCKHCKNLLKPKEIHWCSICEMHRWFCENEACTAINFKKRHSENLFCDKCKAKKGSDFSNCKSFEIFDKDRIALAWQCLYCWQFSHSTSNKCTNNNCGNLRIGNNYRVCSCNWVNLSIKDKCQKCYNDLDTKV